MMIKLLKNRNVVILWLSRALSRFGDALDSLALMYLVYDLTGSGLAMGTVLLFGVIPNLLISPIAGVIVDRYNKKFVMFISEITRAVFILMIPVLIITGQIQIWHVYSISVVVSIAESFFEPCSGVVFTQIVSRDELPLLNSLSSTTNSIMRVVGYSVAGIVIAFLGKEMLFMFDSFTFLISAVAAIIMKIPKLEVKKLEKISDIGKDLMEGIKYVSKHEIMPVLLIAILIINALGTPATQFIPIFSDKVLHLDATWSGYFLTLASVGSIIGGVVYPILIKLKMKLKQLYLYCFSVMGIMMILTCYVPSRYIALFMFFIIGVLLSTIMIWSSTEIQKSCKTEYFGRVFSFVSIVMIASIPFASTVYGWLIDRSSLLDIFKGTGYIFIICAFILYMLVKKFADSNESDKVTSLSRNLD